jgi:hypothetical protein
VNSSTEFPFHYAHYFIPEFIERMRESRECPEKPSPRQTINMGKLLLPMYMRRGCLTFEDILHVAVVTSHVDCQKAAERIAVEILVSAESGDLEKDKKLEGDELLSLLSKIQEEVSIVPHPQGHDQDYIATDSSAADVFTRYQNKPDIGVGPGEDRILKAGVKAMRERRDERTQQVLAMLLKERLLKLGREFERKEDWSRLYNVRPFQPGEDPELIDEDRSLDNILDLGRDINEIRYDDFLMQKRRKRSRNIVYIQDVSNTMFYDYEGMNSINYSILSLVPLMWGLRRDKYGLILYESNSHVMKELTDERDIEPILEELIEMITSTTTEMEKRFKGTADSSTWGGTVPNKSLQWGYDQLIESGDRSEKICFIFSDFVLTEPGKETPESLKNYALVEKMINEGIHVLACVSPLAYRDIFRPYAISSINKLRNIGCPIAETYRPSNFLEMIQLFIDELD